MAKREPMSSSIRFNAVVNCKCRHPNVDSLFGDIHMDSVTEIGQLYVFFLFITLNCTRCMLSKAHLYMYSLYIHTVYSILYVHRHAFVLIFSILGHKPVFHLD
jgi:hypothetical protein